MLATTQLVRRSSEEGWRNVEALLRASAGTSQQAREAMATSVEKAASSCEEQISQLNGGGTPIREAIDRALEVAKKISSHETSPTLVPIARIRRRRSGS